MQRKVIKYRYNTNNTDEFMKQKDEEELRKKREQSKSEEIHGRFGANDNGQNIEGIEQVARTLRGLNELFEGTED